MSDFDRVFLRKSAFVPSHEEDVDDTGLDQAAEHEPPAAGREGLPPTFRMRADPHYVDLLTARAVAPPVHLLAVADITGARPVEERELDALVESIRAVGLVQPLIVRRRKGRYELIAGSRRLAAAKAAGLTEVPCLLREADDERARVLADAENLRFGRDRRAPADAAPSGLPAEAAHEIIDSLATIESCLNLFLDRDRPLRECVAANLVRAEAHRARWLAEAHSLLGGEPPVLSRKGINPSSLIGRALQGLEAQGRLANVKLALTIDEPTRTLVADERLMAVALTGAAGAMLGLLQGVGDAVLRVRVSTHPATRLLAIRFSQDLVAAPGTRPEDGGQALPDWPGGRGSSLGLAVAERVMALHGGQLDIGPGPRGGCTLTLTLPAGD